MTGKTIGAQVRAKTDKDSAGTAKCPRCGYTAPYFDLLAIQPNHIPREALRPVYKCPECKHLFALAADAA